MESFLQNEWMKVDEYAQLRNGILSCLEVYLANFNAFVASKYCELTVVRTWYISLGSESSY